MSFEPKATSETDDTSPQPRGLFSALKVNVCAPLASWLYMSVQKCTTIALYFFWNTQTHTVSKTVSAAVLSCSLALFDVCDDDSYWNLCIAVLRPVHYIVHKLSLVVFKHYKQKMHYEMFWNVK